jgi:hypothetical protein
MVKQLDIDNPPAITSSMQQAVAGAYRDYPGARPLHITVPPREHLGTEFRSYACCAHAWKIAPPTAENKDFVRALFEEDDGVPFYCERCGALSLWNSGGLWAYDVTPRFFGKPGRPSVPQRPQQRRK